MRCHRGPCAGVCHSPKEGEARRFKELHEFCWKVEELAAVSAMPCTIFLGSNSTLLCEPMLLAGE